MRLSIRPIIITMLVAAIVGVLALMPAVAAVGTVVLDKTHVSPDGGAAGTVNVTLTDSDLNIATVISGETLDTTTTTLTAGLTEVIFLANTNVIAGTVELNNNTTTSDDETDPAVLDLDLDDSVQGRITITAGVAGYAGDLSTTTIDYEYATAENVDVAVTSTVGLIAGITVNLTETGANDGIYTGSFIVDNDPNVGGADDDVTDTITGKAGLQSGRVTVTYGDDGTDRTAAAIVEDDDPLGTVVSPADDSRTTADLDNNTAVTLTVQITDALAGVDPDTITFNVAPDIPTITPSGAAVPTSVTALAGGGYQATLDLAVEGLTDPDTVAVTWGIAASDLAGNVDATVLTGIVVVVDGEAPTMTTAQTGTWWDTALDINGDPNGVTGAVANEDDMNTSIEVVFGEALDPASVAAADFTVDDVAPSAATVFAGDATRVFLTVPALDATDTPDVELVAGISDAAGNSQGAAGPIVAADGIAPTVTWSLSATLVQGGTDVVLDFSADEPLLSPVVERNGVIAASQVVDVTTNSYRVTHVTDENGANDGAYALEITVSDGISSTIVGTDLVVDSDIVYEVDTDLPDPVITDSDGDVIADEGDVEEASPLFITFNYVAEGREYGLGNIDTDNVDGCEGLGVVTPTTNPLEIDCDQDAHGDVTVTVVTLDGVDVLATLDTQDDVTFDVALAGVAVGDHTIVITATDDGGNSDTFTRDFTVVARNDYSVNMNLGWNLVSLPADPVDTSIDSVLPSTHPATEVLTFQNGEWLVALRGADGMWSSASTLTSMDSSHAYWVNSLSSTPITVLLVLEFGDAQVSLPTIAVVPGWNMVPVTDLLQRDFGTHVDPDDYMTTITWRLAYGFTAGAWNRITPDGLCNATVIEPVDCLQTGRGYWVWVTGAGTLVP